MLLFLQVKPEEVVDKWYSESKQHKFGEEPQEGMFKTGENTRTFFKIAQHFWVGDWAKKGQKSTNNTIQV